MNATHAERLPVSEQVRHLLVEPEFDRLGHIYNDDVRAILAELDQMRSDRDYQRHRAEQAERRCWAEHPTDPSAIACCAERGHEGDHWSTSGCAGSRMSWSAS